jgi:hypothetical protein
VMNQSEIKQLCHQIEVQLEAMHLSGRKWTASEDANARLPNILAKTLLTRLSTVSIVKL